MGKWHVGQFGKVVDAFKESECPSEAWDDVLLRYAMLVERGKECGPQIAKKLKNAKGIWELLGHADNCQPRLLFYFDDSRHQIVFVHAFVKKGNKDYKAAIELAQDRRRLIERGKRQANVISVFNEERKPKSPVIH